MIGKASSHNQQREGAKRSSRNSSAWAEWIELIETLAKFQAERGKETSDDKGSNDITSKAERKRKSDASPVEFYHRSLARGNVWGFFADLLKIMKLWGVDADNVKEVRGIVLHIFTNIVKPARSKRDSQQTKTHVDHLLFQLVDDMNSMLDANSFLDQAQEFFKKAIDEHATYNTAELDRSRPIKK